MVVNGAYSLVSAYRTAIYIYKLKHFLCYILALIRTQDYLNAHENNSTLILILLFVFQPEQEIW